MKPSPLRRAVVSSVNGSNSGRGSSIASAAAGTFSPTNSGRYVACWSASPHRLIAVETPAGARHATAMPMSPWASASLISTEVTAERSSTAPPSCSGTPTIVRPSSFAWARSSVGAAQALSASWAAGRRRASAEVAHRLGQHLLLVARGEVEQVPGLGPRLARGRGQLLGGGEGPSGAGGRPHGRLRRAVKETFGRLADAQPIDQIGGGKAVERAQADGHAALGDVLVLGHRRRGRGRNTIQCYIV